MRKLKLKGFILENNIWLEQSIIADRHVVYFNIIHADRDIVVLLLTLIAAIGDFFTDPT